jgi:hypothetical protein
MGTLDEYIALSGGAARSSRCAECWSSVKVEAAPDAHPDLPDALDPTILEVEQRLRSFFERRRSSGD